MGPTCRGRSTIRCPPAAELLAVNALTCGKHAPNAARAAIVGYGAPIAREREIPDRDIAGSWQEFIAGAVSLLGASDFGAPVPPVGDLVSVCALVVPDYGVLDELFALRDREDPEDFERGWDVKSMWAVMEFDAQQWARLDVQVLAPVLAMTRVVMDVAAVRPVLLLAAEGRSVQLVRETSLTSSASPSAVLDASLEVFKGRSSVLDELLA